MRAELVDIERTLLNALLEALLQALAREAPEWTRAFAAPSCRQQRRIGPEMTDYVDAGAADYMLRTFAARGAAVLENTEAEVRRLYADGADEAAIAAAIRRGHAALARVEAEFLAGLAVATDATMVQFFGGPN